MNARLNVDRFAAVPAKRLRFTILATNNLEPCVDELEVFNTAGIECRAGFCRHHGHFVRRHHRGRSA